HAAEKAQATKAAKEHAAKAHAEKAHAAKEHAAEKAQATKAAKEHAAKAAAEKAHAAKEKAHAAKAAAAKAAAEKALAAKEHAAKAHAAKAAAAKAHAEKAHAAKATAAKAHAAKAHTEKATDSFALLDLPAMPKVPNPLKDNPVVCMKYVNTMIENMSDFHSQVSEEVSQYIEDKDNPNSDELKYWVKELDKLEVEINTSIKVLNKLQVRVQGTAISKYIKAIGPIRKDDQDIRTKFQDSIKTNKGPSRDTMKKWGLRMGLLRTHIEELNKVIAKLGSLSLTSTKNAIMEHLQEQTLGVSGSSSISMLAKAAKAATQVKDATKAALATRAAQAAKVAKAQATKAKAKATAATATAAKATASKAAKATASKAAGTKNSTIAPGVKYKDGSKHKSIWGESMPSRDFDV
ncbi:hypothetical protein T484DRAFT_1757981, partial [Baffinella frigidus]